MSKAHRPYAVPFVLALLLVGCHTAPPGDSGPPGDGTPDLGATGGDCDARRYFVSEGWPTVFQLCANCHVPGGASGGTRFVLRPPWEAGAVEENYVIASTAA